MSASSWRAFEIMNTLSTLNPSQPPGSDWTNGGDALHFQHCKACANIWYFFRPFCPSCGNQNPPVKSSLGRGVVFTQTLVHRAPDAKFRELAPYKIILVNLDEGFRIMAHGDKELVIGDSVMLSFITLLDQKIPYFKKI